MAFEDFHKPIPQEERKLLVKATWQSGLILLAIALVLAYAYLAITAGDPLAPFTTMSLVSFYVDQLLPEPLDTGVWGFMIAPAFMLAAFVCLDLELKRALKSYDQDNLELRHGLMGEIVAMDRKFFAFVAFCNIFEEVLFRGTLIPICLGIAALFGIQGYPASMIALIVSTLLFWLIHLEYRNKTSVIITLFGGLMFGMFYLMWGCLLIPYLAHVVYNFYVITRENRMAGEDPDYYGGEQPVTMLLDMEEEAKAKKASE